MESNESRSFSGLAFLVISIASGCLTWLCVRWFGAQDPLTAAIAVILVELFIACFAMIAVLITERVSATYLAYEKTHLEKPVQARRLWLWRPLWEPRVRYVATSIQFQERTEDWRPDLHRDGTRSDTIIFPDRSPAPQDQTRPQRRAA